MNLIDESKKVDGQRTRMALGRAVREVQTGFATGERSAVGVVQLRMNNVTTSGTFNWETITRVPCDAVTLARYQLRAGDVLFNNTNSTELVGKSALFCSFNEPVVFSNHFTRLRTDPEILEPAFLAHWLQHQWRQGKFAAICNRWVGQSSVQRGKLLNLEIELPSLPEQRRIAALLGEQIAIVERGRKSIGAQLDNTRVLQQAFLREAFEGNIPLTVSPDRDAAPSGWQWERLSKLARLESGHTPSRRRPDWWGGSIPWIALPDIRALDGRVAMETKEYTNQEGIANSSARVLPARTVVLSRTASVGFVTIMGRPMATSQDFVNWVCSPRLHPNFLMYLFLAAREKILSLAAGAVHKTVYMPTVKAFEVCIPDPDTQKRVAAQLEEKFKMIDRLTSTLDTQLVEVESLPLAFLREAFAQTL